METLKAKVLSDVGVKFCQFKSKLTTDYICGKRKEENPCAKYTSIDEETLQHFVNIRQTEKWQVSITFIFEYSLYILTYY